MDPVGSPPPQTSSNDELTTAFDVSFFVPGLGDEEVNQGFNLDDISEKDGGHADALETAPSPRLSSFDSRKDDSSSGLQHIDISYLLNQPGAYQVDAGNATTSQCLQDRTAGPKSEAPSKMGTRFTSGALRILKAWFSGHSHQPYPTVGDIEALQRQTGLERRQILTWFSNARRRRKPQTNRPPTPSLRQKSHTVHDTTHRQSFSPSSEDMNPLQRWRNSPPDQEPATASAIARAVSDFSDSEWPHTFEHAGSDSLLQSWDTSSASSAVISHSSGSSVASSHSVGSGSSRDSVGSGGSLHQLRKSIKRRRRRVVSHNPHSGDGLNSLTKTCHTFQCTFCTETFKTKHNWQRHEKSLHLSLEQWECSPQGPAVFLSNGDSTCVYCEQVNPDQIHLNEHNPTACIGRAREDRLFYRKDHLKQHLRLVHNANSMTATAEKWKREVEEICSRCGFCGLTMNFWSDRVDHLAAHFRDGRTMASWEGDWGFDGPTLDMVENSVPPYFIHAERNSPWPFTTTQGPPGTPASAFELIKVELEYFRINHLSQEQCLPSIHDLQYEGCCIIFGSEMLAQTLKAPASSWLRDLLMSSEAITQRARSRPTKASSKARITQLRIHSKEDIFEECSMEDQLQKYVAIPSLLDLTVEDDELQREASNIVHRMHASSPSPSDMFTELLTSLIWSSTRWLTPFRKRAGLPERQFSPSLIQARPKPQPMKSGVAAGELVSAGDVGLISQPNNVLANFNSPDGNVGSATPLYFNDSNCYRRLSRELSRFVASTISPHNPNSHIPSDEELQYQARWIMFEDDDPWNQTPADNPYWLRDFKRDIGLLPSE